MIYGTGVDIVSNERIEACLEKFSGRFCKKVLSDAEILEYGQYFNQVNYLAKHFAAKEAFAKALGTGFRDNLTFKDITILHDDYGKPELSFSPHVENILKENAINGVHLSLSDEKLYTVAMVILESR